MVQSLRSVLTRSNLKQVGSDEDGALDAEEVSFLKRVGGAQILAFKLSRFVATLTLTGLVARTAVEHAWDVPDVVLTVTSVCTIFLVTILHTC